MGERKGLDGEIRHIPTRPASPGPIGGYPPARERELQAEVERLKSDRSEFVKRLHDAAAARATAQPVLDAAAAWYETQLHTPLAPKMKARTALILAIKDYKAL